MNQEKIIIGVDPGSIKTGFGIVKLNGDKTFSHISHGVIALDAKKPITERIKDLAFDLDFLLTKYEPTTAVIEDIFLFKNPRSALILGQARGAIMAMMGIKKIPVNSFTPSQVKSLVAGQGRAKKFQVAHMVAITLGIELPKQEDASDALALALAGIFFKN